MHRVGLPTAFLDHAARDVIVREHRMGAADVARDVLDTLRDA